MLRVAMRLPFLKIKWITWMMSVENDMKIVND
jgi:hypothetical protein